MRKHVGGAAALALILVLAPGPAPAEADVAIPGTHRQPTEARIDFGPYADYVTRVHPIAAGDTFQALAKTYLGSAGRWKEIADLNPQMKAEALPVRKPLLLPPAKKPLPAGATAKAGGPQHWWDILSVNLPSDFLQHVESGKDVPWGPYSCWLLAIRHDKVAEVLAAGKAHKRGLQGAVADLIAAKADWVARTEKSVAARGSVEDSDPVWKIRVESRLTSIGQGTIQLKELARRFYGRDGKELSKEQIAARKTGWNIVLILLASLGVVGLLYLARRRRPASRGAPAAS